MTDGLATLGYYAGKAAASLRSRAGARWYVRRYPQTRSDFKSPDYEAVWTQLQQLRDVEFHEYVADEERFRRWLADARYSNFAYIVNRTEKFLEHQVSFDLLALPPSAVVIDVASCRSPFPEILRRQGHRVIAQDLDFEPGLRDEKLGGSAAEMALPDASVDGMTLHCSFEHFEGEADSGFVREAARVLRPRGRVVILPLYVHEQFINMTDPIFAPPIAGDPGATQVAVFGYANRFGRHYDVAALRSRVIEPAVAAGLVPSLYRIRNEASISPKVYLNFALVLAKPTPSPVSG